jgi:hypothetical protein
MVVLLVDGELIKIEDLQWNWPARNRTFSEIWHLKCKMVKMYPELKNLNLFNIHRFDNIKASWTIVHIPEFPEYYQYSATVWVHLMEPGAGGLISSKHTIYY